MIGIVIAIEQRIPCLVGWKNRNGALNPSCASCPAGDDLTMTAIFKMKYLPIPTRHQHIRKGGLSKQKRRSNALAPGTMAEGGFVDWDWAEILPQKERRKGM
jgi:hypothetical protein